MSEINNYLYSMGRFADVQVVFWGNPTTPGHVDSVDYYMSGDVMEIDAGQTHYTEQLIRLEGQAIWCVPRGVMSVELFQKFYLAVLRQERYSRT
jgi:hypothetical protein